MANDQRTLFQVQYKDVAGFPGYRVGNDGSVWSRRSRNGKGSFVLWRILKPIRSDHNGYRVVTFWKNSRPVRKFVAQLVLEAFVGPRPPGKIVCHFPDKDTANNSLNNIRWDTYTSNYYDMVIHGTVTRGSRHGMSKLRDEDVRKIRRLHARGHSYDSLGERYGVAGNTIGRIIRGTIWKHLI